VAVVTGGGSGIGRGTVLALAEAGMHVVVADIDEDSAKTVTAEAEALGPRSIAVRTDVSDKASLEALADAAYKEFGAVHVLHNNAGVLVVNRLDATTDKEWEWILSINLEGVVNGLQTFLPRMKAQDGEKHIVNTASMAGMIAGRTLGAYNATKFAIVAISETLHDELSGEGFGVSVLCPGGVATNIFAHAVQQAPQGAGDPAQINMDTDLRRMMDPNAVGRLVRYAIENDELYIFTHPEFEKIVRARFDRILSAFEKAGQREDPRSG
jgi:NAD(P)-dependent dehydrogenase (short-subunit alcohol dehydrogenase family)